MPAIEALTVTPTAGAPASTTTVTGMPIDAPGPISRVQVMVRVDRTQLGSLPAVMVAIVIWTVTTATRVEAAELETIAVTTPVRSGTRVPMAPASRVRTLRWVAGGFVVTGGTLDVVVAVG